MINEIVYKNIQNQDEHLVGFADLRGLLNNEFLEYNYGILIAKKLDDNIINAINKGPTKEYFDLYNSTNSYLSDLVTDISNELTENNIACTPILPTRILSYGDTNFRNFSHKMVATRSGLGWIGKTALFISKKFGPRIRLATILTKTPPDDLGTPINKSLCGNCSLCIKSCPAGASNGMLWDINTDRDDFFDVNKCYEKTGELSFKNLGVDKHICGICISVCPIGS